MIKCEMMQDLLPLYCDKVCSGETRRAVEEHLAVCPDCRNCLEQLTGQSKPVTASPGEDAKARVRRGTKKRFSRRRRRSVFITVAAMLVLSLVLIGAADVERPVEYRDGLITGGLAVDEVIDLYYHGGNYSSFNGFSREVGGRDTVFLCFNQTLKSNVLPPLGEGHIAIGNTLLTDHEMISYRVGRHIDAVYYLVGDYVRLPAMDEAEFEKELKKAVLLWERQGTES